MLFHGLRHQRKFILAPIVEEKQVREEQKCADYLFGGKGIAEGVFKLGRKMKWKKKV